MAAPESFAYSGCRMEPALMGKLSRWRARRFCSFFFMAARFSVDARWRSTAQI